ncbi:hypothetical protein AAU61_14620 [Desulfocarbo indianensis]|nr:hypothetical protein AAU61_14620 [Desulfocarbo indianensis]
MALWDQEPLGDDGYCFACGKNNPHGLQMRVVYEEADKSASCRLSLARRFQGWSGIAHGGVVATLMDEIMAHAVIRHVGQALTTDMQSRYRAPVPLDQELAVRGWVAEINRRLATTQAEVRLAEGGKLLAEAQARFLLRPE